jgi:hypothetical protein
MRTLRGDTMTQHQKAAILLLSDLLAGRLIGRSFWEDAIDECYDGEKGDYIAYVDTLVSMAMYRLERYANIYIDLGGKI